MIGALLLFLSLIWINNPQKKYLSIFFYLSFMLGYNGGFGLWNDDITGIKTGDCAVIYTIIGNLNLLAKSQWKLPKFKFIPYYILFLLFFLCDIVFSIVHYELSVFQVIQGSRSYFLFLSLPILVSCEINVLTKVFRLLFYVCFATSVLYILQILVFRTPLMPYSYAWEYDSTTGLPRLYNVPENLILFLTLTFTYPEYLKGKINVNACLFIFITALLCTLGRSGVFANLAILFLTLLFTGKVKKIAKTMLLLIIMALPLSDLMLNRFNEGKTSEDMQVVMSGDFTDGYSDGQTFAYRMAWCYERIVYLIDRPIGEQFFGLGLCSESQPWVRKHYDFAVAIPNENTGERTQLGTGDIAYGNMITRLGFLGTAIYILFVISLTSFFWKVRKQNIMYAFFCSNLICLFAASFTGSMLSEPKTFVMMFMFLSLEKSDVPLERLLLEGKTNKVVVK